MNMYKMHIWIFFVFNYSLDRVDTYDQYIMHQTYVVRSHIGNLILLSRIHRTDRVNMKHCCSMAHHHTHYGSQVRYIL